MLLAGNMVLLVITLCKQIIHREGRRSTVLALLKLTGPFHWTNRKLGILELKPLQTFPDWYQIPKSNSINYWLIGNDVPPLLAKKVGESIRTELLKNVNITEEKYDQTQLNELNVRSGWGSSQGKFHVVDGKVVAAIQMTYVAR